MEIDKPLDFSKQSPSSKTPPISSSDDEDHNRSNNSYYGRHMNNTSTSAIDQSLNKSLTMAYNMQQQQQQQQQLNKPNYSNSNHNLSVVKGDEESCFNAITPSPSPPERAHLYSSSTSSTMMMAAAAAAAAASSNTSPEDANATLFGQLISQFASHPNNLSKQTNVTNQNIQQNLLKQALQTMAITNGTMTASAINSQQQQAAIIQALMNSMQTINPTLTNLELLQSAMMAKNTATSPPPPPPSQRIITGSPNINKLSSPPLQPQSEMKNSMKIGQPQSMIHSNANIGLLTTTNPSNGVVHYSQYSQSNEKKFESNHKSINSPTNLSTSFTDEQSDTSPTNANHQKYTRPFKALYNSKDSFSAQSPYSPSVLVMGGAGGVVGGGGGGAATATSIGSNDPLSTHLNSERAYQEFRNKMLRSKQGGSNKKNHQNHNGDNSEHNFNHRHLNNHHHSDDSHSVVSSNSSDCGTGVNICDSQQSMPLSLITPPASNYEPIVSTTPISGVTPSKIGGNTSASQTSSSQSSANGGSSRKRGRPLPEDLKDEAYWERRRKNNEAAKRSRDLRRAKEDEIAIRAAFLEQENFQLKVELMKARVECEKMRSLWMSSQQQQQQSPQQT
ncbi:hypothetical protein BLOT_011507 [Blomia tropicalis]|nr:hypothetical protein BLOT_011507 [Blomia tropicalis]